MTGFGASRVPDTGVQVHKYTAKVCSSVLILTRHPDCETQVSDQKTQVETKMARKSSRAAISENLGVPLSTLAQLEMAWDS